MQIAADAPKMRDSFTMKTSQTSDEVEESIAIFLSTEPGSATLGRIASAYFGRENRYTGAARERLPNFPRRFPRGGRGGSHGVRGGRYQRNPFKGSVGFVIRITLLATTIRE